jgi:hypothetical protein
MSLPRDVAPLHATRVAASPNYFVYDEHEACDQGLFVWHLNFANFDLFSAYGSGLFAQDEMQVAEHPVLASLREALLRENLSTLTIEKCRPTPILVRGAERRVRIATEPNAAEERPNGLYGNQFARAKAQAVRKATTKLAHPTLTNLIAIEAPPGGTGSYTRRDIEEILGIAYSGFRAAKLEANAAAPGRSVVVHTGFWGCGAYGGNRELMSILQLYAARAAGIDQFAFHAGDDQGCRQFESAVQILNQFMQPVQSLEDLIDLLVARKYQWGVGDGN